MATIVDTNVASELVKQRPEPNVIAWWHSRIATELFTTAITEAELRRGIAILPPGRRSVGLSRHVDRILRQHFPGRVLSFDSVAARAYADIWARRRAMGRPIAHADCQIAAIARSQGMAIATRNVNDFRDCGVTVINPWPTE